MIYTFLPMHGAYEYIKIVLMSSEFITLYIQNFGGEDCRHIFLYDYNRKLLNSSHNNLYLCRARKIENSIRLFHNSDLSVLYYFSQY